MRVAWNKGLKTGYAPWRGKKRGPHSESTRAKMSAAHIGRPKSAEHRANIAKARMGKRHTPETIEKCRLGQLALGRKGPASPIWGKQPPHKKRVLYRGICFRSTFEVRFAKALDALGIAWLYEPQRFDLGACTYLPDFFLPESGVYWEIKGYFGPDSQMKARLFRALYPEWPLVIATHEVLDMIERLRAPALEVDHGGRDVEDRPLSGLGPLAQQCAMRTA